MKNFKLTDLFFGAMAGLALTGYGYTVGKWQFWVGIMVISILWGTLGWIDEEND